MGLPVVTEDSYTDIVTGASSLLVPENRVLMTFDGEATWASVTTGGSVSTTNFTGTLSPATLPSPLVWIATAVNVRSPDGIVTELDVQPDPVPMALASLMIVPLATTPSKMWTTTSVCSLAVPENVSVTWREGDFGWFRVTDGDAVLISKVIGALTPSLFPRELSCEAKAAYLPFSSPGLTAAVTHVPELGWALSVRIGFPSALLPS